MNATSARNIAKAAKKTTIIRREQSTEERIFWSTFHAARAEQAPQYETDRHGNKIRVWSRANPCTRQAMLDLLRGKRVVEKEEVLEIVGREVFRCMVKAGEIRKDAHGAPWFWITKAAAKHYGLEKPLGGLVDFVD